MSRTATSRVEHAPALDGLRAVAVLAVLAYHGGVHAVPGGYLGVDVFLVLSGYLITALLLAEWRRAGRIDLGRFWERRIRRLLPALALVVGAVVVHAAAAGSSSQVRGEAVASLTWTQNWYLALRDSSYFALFTEASPLRHIWSLALEAQWYLVWPLVVALILRFTGGATRTLAAATLALAAASAALMAVSFDPGADPSRIYYGTDTRGHVLLIGAALALYLHRAPSEPARPGRGWVVGGFGGVAVLAWAFANLADLEPRLYRGGFAVVGLAAAAVVAAAVRTGSPVERVLRLPPLPALGRISYGVYLWHWPLYVWFGSSVVTTAAAIGLAVVSYRIVELPVRTAPRAVRRPALVLSLAAAAAVVAG
ncbi:MAG TPA: acyltransferase, partial [Acidimicrobiia bacterium]|nr:acyltransferase [Acidimicrobiia bacterium]